MKDRARQLYEDLSKEFVRRGIGSDDFSKLTELYNFADAIIDNIINTPDDEILKEVIEEHGDPEHEANIMREIISKAKEERTCSNCKDKSDCTIKHDNHGESCQMHNFEGE